MINFKQYGIDSIPSSITWENLICLANIERKNIDSKVIQIVKANQVKINGRHEGFENKYAIVGSNLVKILSLEISGNDTIVTFEKGIKGVLGEHTVNNHFRTVVILDDRADMIPQSWEFNDTVGNVSTNLFPVELGSGNITLKSDLALWSPLSPTQKYKVRNRKSIAYIFKGFNDKLFLKYTTIINKIRFNTKGKREPNKIILDIKTMLGLWYDKDVVINKQLKGTTPKEFFKMVFSLSDTEVYYAQGVDENSFPKINNLHTKEYNKMSELLKAYCSNGIRFCFDKLERVKIFGDFKVDNINSTKILKYDITDSMLSEDDQLIYNTINTQSYQRQTLYNFDDLDRKYVKFYKVKRNAVNSNSLIVRAENGDYNFKSVIISDNDFRESVQLTDYVLFKRTQEPYIEVNARVVEINSDSVVVVPIIYDKDRNLFNIGKGKYLYDLLSLQSVPMDLYYVRHELPMVWKLSQSVNNDKKDSNLMKPILPKVNGEAKYIEEISGKFGSASNAKVGKFTDIVEEIDKIYGTWDSSKLLYNRELEQFSNTSYPPIFLLSNMMEERLVQNNPIQNFTTFDNSNIMLEIDRPKTNENDFVLKIQNNFNVNSDIDLFKDKEIGRAGNKIIQVNSLTPYKLGDVLIVNRPDNLTPQEEVEFDEILKNIKWRITAKVSENSIDGTTKNYIYLDSPFAKRQKTGEVYEFTRFPNTSIVYVQELYFRGNPVLEYVQDVIGYSKDVNYEGETSREIYGEKIYDLDSKQLNKDNLRLLMGYILDNFSAVNKETTKFNVPISVFNALDLELLDVIRIEDTKYTQIKKDMLWVILGITSRNSTNEIQIKAINVNKTNTKPYKIDIKDVIDFKPVDIPTYDHTGGEGNVDKNDDGTGGTAEDKSLGQFWLAKVDSEKFRARVDKFENNYIYFKDFNGTEVEQYKGKLFPVSEFAVNIKGEVIFVQSDSNFRAFIKKRKVYDTEEVVIAPEDEVSFLVTTTYVDIDGTFYGRKMMMGDGDSYLSVDPITGVKIVGDFVVGENNQHAGNDLWQSMQKNKTFQQAERPIDTPSYILKEGDIWYDIDDENHAYRYDGKVWISARDGSIVSTQNNVFIQPEEPIDKDGRPLINGDTWYDSDDGMKPYIYQDGKWVNVTDMTLQEAIDRVEQQANESTQKLEDIASDNRITPDEKTQVSQEWETIKGEYPKIKNEAVKFGITPTNYNLRYDILDGYITPILSDMLGTTDIDRVHFKENFVNYYNSRQDLINSINDKIKSSAIEEAVQSSKDYSDKIVDSLGNDLTVQIDGKINSYNQDTDPSLEWEIEDYEKHTGDLWYKPSEKITKRWDGTQWKDLDAKDVIAQEIAKNKRRVFVSQPTVPYDIGDLWVTSVSNGDLLVCVNNKQSGEYDIADWKKATKYTDDTRANEALHNAQTAQQEADKANDMLNDISNDNKLTPDEKQSTKKEWEEINSEYTHNVKQAKIYGVDSSNYTTSFNQLQSYLTPLLVNLNTTESINGDEFRRKFKEYYDSRQVLLGDVYGKIKESSLSEAKDYADRITSELNKDLINQIDGKIDTFRQENDPSIQWTSSDDKKKHIGDLWYQPSIKTTKRWNGTSWDTLDAKDEVAQELAKTKRTVFTKQPTTPYDAGDLWLTNISDGGDLMVCKTSRSTGGFIKEDWTIATKYTDDTKAKEAFQNAIKAQSSAEGALSQLSDLASDNKLTSVEKQITQKEWETILAEYPRNLEKARLYEVETTEYTSKYNELKLYIEPLLAKLTTTSEVVGTVFRQHFKEYYDAEIKLTGDIYDKVKESAVRDSKAYADSIDTKLVGYLEDGVLTPQEKGDLRNEITTIESRASSIKLRAKTFNVSTDMLTQCVNKLIEWRSGVLSQDGVYSNLQQVNILRQDFRNYYTEEEKVYDGIDKKSKELADKAQSDANGALGLLADISSDNKFTSSEKQSTQKEWEIIVSEYPKNKDQANVYGVDSSDYTSKYNVLKSYIEPLLTNINITSDINGETFRTNFKNYYDSRLQLLNTISTKALEIGFMQNGKMLYLDPTFKEGLNNMDTYSSTPGLITLSRMSGDTYGKNPPNDSNMVVAVVKKAGDTYPDMGGFAFRTQSRPGMKLMSKIVAHIPVGYKIRWGSNATGDNRKEYWVTSREGTGEFREYVHVLECGTTGKFDTTSHFYLTADDGDNSKAITWGVSYATVFDAGSNQNDYLTQALGNAKIFFHPEKPTSGMKENDLWYDTDDQNHPYVYIKGQWVSARDKIFETEGKNLVHFSDTKPLINDKSKEGDVWFDTGHNNNQYVLIKNNTGNLEWKLATDAGDKIQNGRIVINGNTTFNGDATIVSRGTQEQTIIQGGSITFTRNGVPITAIRNMRFGEIETDSNGRGFISFPGFKNMRVLLSIKSFAIGQNVRSLGCYANLVNLSENKYQCFIYGTQSQLGTGAAWTSTAGAMSTSYSLPDIMSISINTININNSQSYLTYDRIEALAGPYDKTSYRNNQVLTQLLFQNIPDPYPVINIKVYRITAQSTVLVSDTRRPLRLLAIYETDRVGHDEWGATVVFSIKPFNTTEVVDIKDVYTQDNIGTLGYRVEVSLVHKKFKFNGYLGNNRYVKNLDLTASDRYNSSTVIAQGTYHREKIENLTGHGTLFYLGFEE